MQEEKRLEERSVSKLGIVGSIRHSDADPSLIGCPIICEAINISGHGIQFRSDLELQEGTLISISIAYKPSEIYTVEGNVRWCKLKNGQPILGVRLIEDKATDFEAWLELLRANLE